MENKTFVFMNHPNHGVYVDQEGAPFIVLLRLLTESLILIGSAMLGETFNLVTLVGLVQFLEH